MPAVNSSECCSQCRRTWGCVGFTHYQSKCYLKEAATNRVDCADCASGLLDPPPNATMPAKWEMAGMTFTGGRYCPNVSIAAEAGAASMRRLASTGATWISIVVTQYQRSVNATEIFPLYNGSAVPDPGGYYEFVTLGEDELTRSIRTAHALGLKVMLKPHVDLLYTACKPGHARCSPGHNGLYWRGDIGGCYPQDAYDAPFGAQAWETWFASYERFLLPYAQLAQQEGVELLSMNCELYLPQPAGGSLARAGGEDAADLLGAADDVRNQRQGGRGALVGHAGRDRLRCLLHAQRLDRGAAGRRVAADPRQPGELEQRVRQEGGVH
jgi:hypothetical protein